MPAAITTNKISFSYGDKQVVNDISLSFQQGELTCLLGPNGAGKTTLINLILGRLPSKNQTLCYFEQDYDFTKVKSRIGAMLQNSTAPERAKVIELIQVFSSYYANPFNNQELIELLQLEPILQQRFGQLSGGQKQLVLFALALCGDPDILFLDEPTVGMDVEVRRILWQVVESLKQRGKTIILTTHYLEEADALADRIVVLRQGSVIADGSPSQIKAKLQHKHIKARTNKPLDWLQNLPHVSSAQAFGQYVELVSNAPEQTLATWLTQDNSVSDLTITAADLEHAFIHLVAAQQDNGITNTTSSAA